MCCGDRSRKQVLVDYGFRLPSALDNRPLTFDEFRERVHQVDRRQRHAGHRGARAGGRRDRRAGHPPDGPARSGDRDPAGEGPGRRPARRRARDAGRPERARAGHDADQADGRGADELLHGGRRRCRYLHSDIETLERVAILSDFRRGVFDCLIGINLLREGLDLPEVAVVAILDADKEGFLRSETSLIQTSGRAARNLDGRVLFYADAVTDSMRRAMDETTRRRAIQEEYNTEHGIEPASIIKQIDSPLVRMANLDYYEVPIDRPRVDLPDAETRIRRRIADLEKQMKAAAKELDFEKAAALRDEIRGLRELEIFRSLSRGSRSRSGAAGVGCRRRASTLDPGRRAGVLARSTTIGADTSGRTCARRLRPDPRRPAACRSWARGRRRSSCVTRSPCCPGRRCEPGVQPAASAGRRP